MSDRVGDLDRSRTTAVLGRALSGGYLDALEYQDRLELALAARTRPALGDLTADLPSAVFTDPDRARRMALVGLRVHVAAGMLAVLVCWLVWLAVGMGAGSWYPWPTWPTLAVGLGLAGHASLVQGIPTRSR